VTKLMWLALVGLTTLALGCTQTKYVEVVLSPTPPASTYTEAQVIGIARNWPLAQREELGEFAYNTLGSYLIGRVALRCETPVPITSSRPTPTAVPVDVKWAANLGPEKKWEVSAKYSACGQDLSASWLFLEDGPKLLPVSGIASSARLRASP
jgi:hypothetical protein